MKYLIIAAAVWLAWPALLEGANVLQVFEYDSTVSTGRSGGALDLLAELNYDDSRTDAPIAVVMHGYSPATGNFGNVRGNAQRLRDAGFFVVSVAMRGRDGSAGVRDSGGVEIYDIYEAVEAVKATYTGLVDESNVHITGYSGGGGNVMSALTKFPDYFRAGSSFFGMSDYGYDETAGWYFAGAASNHQNQLRTDIGNPTLGDPDVADRYHARASSLAARNNPYSEIHLFVNDNEVTCPPIHVTRYHENAVAAAQQPGEFDNIHVHIAPSHRALYEDFNGNGTNESSERQWWPHGFPTADQQAAGEGWYLGRLLDGSIPEPQLNLSDQLYVAGFVKTRAFEFWIGDGQNGAGLLDYALSESQKSFALNLTTHNLELGSRLTIDTRDMEGQKVDIVFNDQYLESLTLGPEYATEALGHGDSLLLRLALPGDYDKNGAVDINDFYVWRQTFGSSDTLMADGNADGLVDAADFTVWRNGFGNSGDGLGGLVDGLVAVPAPSARASAAVLMAMTLLGSRHWSLELRPRP